jgi:hypothetical protein
MANQASGKLQVGSPTLNLIHITQGNTSNGVQNRDGVDRESSAVSCDGASPKRGLVIRKDDSRNIGSPTTVSTQCQAGLRPSDGQ